MDETSLIRGEAGLGTREYGSSERPTTKYRKISHDNYFSDSNRGDLDRIDSLVSYQQMNLMQLDLTQLSKFLRLIVINH